jgi:hypothetical protein
MDFVGGLPTTRKGYDYLFVIVDMFNKTFILLPCKNIIKGQESTNMFFEHVWVHFGIPRSIISNKDTYFSVPFGLHFGRRWTLS